MYASISVSESAVARPVVALPCMACGLYAKGCATPFMPGTGPVPADVFIAGDYPGFDEDMRKAPWVGPAGQYLRGRLQAHDIDPTRCWMTNMLHCRPARGVDPGKLAWESCRTYAHQERRQARAPVNLILGEAAAKAFLGTTAGMSDLRRLVHFVDGVPTIVSYNPAAGFRDAGFWVALDRDLAWVARACKGALVHEQSYRIECVSTWSQWRAAETELRAASFVTFDLETCPLNPYDSTEPKILCFALGCGHDRAFVVPWAHPQAPAVSTEVWAGVKALLEDPVVLKVAHNAKFDLMWCLHFGIRVRELVACTLMGHHLLDETARHGLDRLTWEFTDMGAYWTPLDAAIARIVAADKVQVDAARKDLRRRAKEYVWDPQELEEALADVAPSPVTYDRIPWDELWPYAGKDAVATWRIWAAMRPLLGEEESLGVMALYARASLTFARMQLRGVRYDLNRQGEIVARMSAMRRDVVAKIRALPTVRKYEQHLAERGEPARGDGYRFNPGSPAQVADLLYKYMRCLPPNVQVRKKSPEATTNAEALQVLARDHAVAAHLLRFRKVEKHDGTYVRPVPTWVACDDRVHTEFFLFGTKTGRPSSRKPNLFNIPRDDDEDAVDLGLPSIKGMWTSRFSGGFIGECDLSQVEVRVMASFSQDPELLAIFQCGGDVHRAAAARAYKIPIEEVTDALRHRTKRIVFGLNYGAQAAKVAALAGCSVPEAEEFLGGYFREFPGVRAHMEREQRGACARGWVRTATGMRRRLPAVVGKFYQGHDFVVGEGLRQAINSPIQGTASHICLTGGNIIDDLFEKYELKSCLISHVYDSWIFDVHPDEKELVCALVPKIMTGLKWPWLTVPLDVEMKVGETWGSATKVK